MEGLEGLSTTEQAWLHPLDHHRKQDPGFYETGMLEGECHGQVQCYPLKTTWLQRLGNAGQQGERGRLKVKRAGTLFTKPDWWEIANLSLCGPSLGPLWRTAVTMCGPLLPNPGKSWGTFFPGSYRSGVPNLWDLLPWWSEVELM